ncbi:SEL1-like repeat protein [Pseudoduganella chitinolytica]|uniref:DUF6396 domain-containing protein n=1 Tax=Pseudoduganella chitinolytica TaxID=34070 RepID=A0ABY8BGB8_9BURK|nr:DUF6396 domain-containing protein [Pseudoduganella chitinolytica]WEF33339.1 DUF6396 domain-containing protein [Pseudoduganella chitinolytica]
MKRFPFSTSQATSFAMVFLLSACTTKDEPRAMGLPRFTKLEAFQPHRADFICKHEADVSPPISPQAEALFQQALARDDHDLWPAQRDYAGMAALYEKAMRLSHWKAQFNLSELHLKGIGVPQDIEKAISLTEDLMHKGMPAAWDNMGTYHMGGVGPLAQDATVAYAFWQKAADLGSMAAQTHIGAKLLGINDQPPDWWANKRVGMQMLECAYAQGYSRAAYELGMEYATLGQADSAMKLPALKYFQQGVRWGSREAAGALVSDFDLGPSDTSSVAREVDKSRSERYLVLANALRRNPDLRFPNLDKVLPLPPAKLPMWDGNKDTLINAAKAVVPKPAAPAKPATQPVPLRTGRAHIPEGWALPDKPETPVTAQYESTAAPLSGYWIARLMHPVTERQQAWNAAQLPLAYKEGELFDRTRPGLRDEDGRIQFHYLGQPVERAAPVAQNEHPLVPRGVGRYADTPLLARDCKGHFPCPEAGIWRASVVEDHPSAPVFNQWHRQAYVA